MSKLRPINDGTGDMQLDFAGEELRNGTPPSHAPEQAHFAVTVSAEELEGYVKMYLENLSLADALTHPSSIIRGLGMRTKR